MTRTVALLSGGKDSLYNMYWAKKNSHEVVAIVNLKPGAHANDELDSYMYQTVGHQAIEKIAQALDTPLFRADITKTANVKDLDYTPPQDSDDEVEILYNLLKDIREKHGIPFGAISVGAIASEYQYNRIRNICSRLGDVYVMNFLFNRDQDSLLQEMIDNRFDAILIKVACMGLNKEHLGKSIKEMQEHLRRLHQEHGANICGEGGEYETLVLDCPLYKKRLSIDRAEFICHSEDVFAPVYYMNPVEVSLVEKNNDEESGEQFRD